MFGTEVIPRLIDIKALCLEKPSALWPFASRATNRSTASVCLGFTDNPSPGPSCPSRNRAHNAPGARCLGRSRRPCRRLRRLELLVMNSNAGHHDDSDPGPQRRYPTNPVKSSRADREAAAPPAAPGRPEKHHHKAPRQLELESSSTH